MTDREPEGTDVEVPVEDALEQRHELADDEPDDDQDRSEDDSLLVEADPADRADQRQVVDLGDDEYR